MTSARQIRALPDVTLVAVALIVALAATPAAAGGVAASLSRRSAAVFLAGALLGSVLLVPWCARPAAAATLFGLIDTGEMFGSSDAGATWQPLSTLPVRDATALAARLSTSDLFIASSTGSIYRSMNSGATWAAVGSVSAIDVVDMAIHPDGSLLVLTSSGAIYRSADLGASFTGIAALTGSNFASLTFTTPAVRFYASTRTGEVYESLDSGTNWVPKGVVAVSNVVRIRAVTGTLYVLTATGDVFRSTDAASSWTAVGTLSQVGMRGLVRSGSSIVAATREGHVATSANGATWTWQGSMNQLNLTALGSDEPATTAVEPFARAGVGLGVPFPNPSSGSASFLVQLARDAEITVGLYDLGGREVARSAPRVYPSGGNTVNWTPNVQKPGLYFLSVTAPGATRATRPWVLIR